MNIYFKPWIGRNYNSSNEKILLLGESHYDIYGNANENFTIEIVNEFLEGEKYKFYINAGLLFNQQNHKEIWDSISFSNLIQTAFPTGKTQPTILDRNTIPENFESILNMLKPDKFIVLSKRLWEWWLPEKNGTKLDMTIKEGKRHSTVWKYNYENGSCLSIGICHPSWMFGKNGTVKEWAAVINQFLAYKA